MTAKIGRPSSFTQKTADEICNRLITGESLRQICRDEGMPGKATVLSWLAKNEAFQAQYARARELQMEHMAEELIEISDDGSNDWMKRELDNGEMIDVVNHEHIQRSRLRADTRKWLMSKLAPKKYGDKIEQKHVGEPNAPLNIVWNGVCPPTK